MEMRKPNISDRVSLITGYEDIIPDIVRRTLLVLLLIVFVTAIQWADRNGLADTARPGEPLSILDVLYFTVVTVTTVGYGDIVPVTPSARLISTLIVTPVRVLVFVIFIGTAYQLVLQRYREAYQMRRIRSRLEDHVIICGYGVKGHATASELLSFGYKAENIVVIDPDPESADDAARDGFVALKADAASEAALRAAAIDKARDVVVDVDRDDSTVLVCLTAKHLNPRVCVVASAREAENVPLIYRSGADVVVAPPIAGGRMLAIATRLAHAPRFIDDILTFGRGLDFGERKVGPEESGYTVDEFTDLAGKLPIGAYHRGHSLPFDRLPGLRFDSGDVIIYLVSKPELHEAT